MWSLSCYKELKLTTNRFTGSTLHGLRIQKQNISLRSSGMRRKQNFKIVFVTFTFRFLSSLLFSLFLPHFFFSLAGHLVGFILVGRVFRKLSRRKPVYRSYTSQPSDPDAKYQLVKFGHAQKAKFRGS